MNGQENRGTTGTNTTEPGDQNDARAAPPLHVVANVQEVVCGMKTTTPSTQRVKSTKVQLYQKTKTLTKRKCGTQHMRIKNTTK